MVLSWSLFNRLDVSIPLFAGGAVLMVPWPGEESRLLAAIRPFQSTVNNGSLLYIDIIRFTII